MHRAREGVRWHRRPQIRQRRAQRLVAAASHCRSRGGQGERKGPIRAVPMRISARAEKIEPFYVMEVAKAASRLAREVAQSAHPMIFLNIGEPDFTAPPLVQEAAAKAIHDGLTQY